MPDRIKTGTLTFHASYNFGSMLQAYALQQTIIQLGYDNEIINLRTPVQKRMYRCFSAFNARSVKNFLERSWIQLRFGSALRKQYNRFTDFLDERVRKSCECASQKDIEKLSHKYDVIISGSDQIWNSSCSDFDWSYLLPFDGIGKVAYAPSFGPWYSKSHLSDYRNQYNWMLKSFDSLSSRERDGAAIIKMICGRQAEVLPDPTFLVSEAEWKAISGDNPIVKGRYMFIYAPHKYGKEFKRIAEFMSRKLALKVVVCNYAPLSFVVPAESEYHMDAGPEQFLNFVKNASFVLCTSFHAVAFSIIFKRPFFAIEGENDSRIANVLQTFHLESRTISIRSLEVRSEYAATMDCSEIDEIMSHQRILGMEYLKSAIDNAATSKR